MGGGDLNMKKHFHPLTRENLELVWQAEQKRDQEVRRIEERKKEIAEERAREELLEHASRHGVIKKREERLEWMYAGYRASSDDFLLGKEITDECIEKMAQERKTQQINRETGVNAGLHTVDLARKIREDPLFVIKKREATATKDLIENSARIKQIIDSSKRDSRHTGGVRKYQDTPGQSKLSRIGWDTPSRHTPRFEEQNSQRRSRKRSRSRSPSSEDNEAKIQKMLNNGKWRESNRKNKLNREQKEEELDRKIEEHIRKLKGTTSTHSLLNDIKMGTWSSKRYLKE
ncbi:hypothetical protein HZS_2277 [Henneguya salminicola]|nr:hypothetical protein HZS_2277 [Henneguya salminicola]